ncbi:DUF6362 family protein [Acuticoccus yangtzensis]|uniref:DUF6362 family protein n=1 Tax=Acuticoccus yangtzensis TaxID=1443441 RepID=UPI0009495F66|nr:DUF6362 family protein [Acuticoccus yangtzensis]
MAEWTRADVEARLESAARVMRSQPGDGPRGTFNAWPTYLHDFADKVGQKPETRRPTPSPRAISEAEDAMLWLRWLEVDDARIVWARADRTAWKPICWQHGISRATAHRRWEYALSVIVWRLNGRRVPAKRSMRYVIDRTS